MKIKITYIGEYKFSSERWVELLGTYNSLKDIRKMIKALITSDNPKERYRIVKTTKEIIKY